MPEEATPQVYEPQHTFSDFQLHDLFLKQIDRIGYSQPTEIQDKSIPVSLQGHDVIGVAGTGTGKTVAFLIPVIQRLLEEPEDLQSLIITPTRELANQISEEFKKLTRGMKLYSSSLIGGLSVGKSLSALRRTNHVIIGTPGRLLDMIRRGALDHSRFKTLILDEFDRMLDMGFQADIQEIVKGMPQKEQTLLFSATLDASQKDIIRQITNKPTLVKAGLGTQETRFIHQDVLRIPPDRKKIDVLIDLVKEQAGEKIILFCETKRKADQLGKMLREHDIKADIIHGDKTQKARETALRKFKQGRVSVLVATDVLARGIDVMDVALVINYEVPLNYNDYIHRIGRTGRAGKTGKALTFIN